MRRENFPSFTLSNSLISFFVTSYQVSELDRNEERVPKDVGGLKVIVSEAKIIQ